ncbi:hypothetical protein HFO38_29285 [Rhizobium leguminosarum]|uniref:hypothetical protein n=1 Tax=Rhizobium leguminosarum TaxID=384 RepID=UPI001C983D19|nr:hypothetical protein [Rhizobium leguminosarum]MBY5706765.1 hypothetical protein [Rhizobium leguminosarum]
MRLTILTAVMLGSAFAPPIMPAKAEDASWGCQVLLCAASQNPSWHGVPYCVPPMTKLIAAMKEPGFSWPICHEANAGKPGHETFDDCPAGTTAGYSSQGDNGWRGEPDQCIKKVDVCRSPSQRGSEAGLKGTVISRSFGDRGDSCIEQIATPRPPRADPYFFDIPNDQGVKQRFWFNLSH